ncbi:MAG: phosphomannomutase [Methylophaga sp.]|nr:phosphomannomutase [Methylophaga sp.]
MAAIKIDINDLMDRSGVNFGTSGVRGLVADMTDEVCFAYVTAFLQYLQQQKLIAKTTKIGIAGDLRSSTPRIMNAAAAACLNMGFEPINAGNIPSPAIALYGLKHSIPSIMVTGSHIPDDRNGIKFNTPLGEILKPDEEGIRAQQVTVPKDLFLNANLIQTDCLAAVDTNAETNYVQRFIDFLPPNCLQGQQLGLYEHSSVSRDCLKSILQKLGANVTSLARTDTFMPVDTEAIRPEDITLAKQWSEQYKFDCIISTDGDGDRPLVSDEKGNWLRGDVAGILCAKYLGAESVITPVSSNSAVEKSGYFTEVIRTKIGSPYVIEAMQAAAAGSGKHVVGYEANGGFLQQTPLKQNDNILSPLPTRDAVIVPLAIILLAKQEQLTIAELLMTLPQRYTHSDRIKEFSTLLSQKIISKLTKGDMDEQNVTIQSYFNMVGEPKSINTTDGLRITFKNNDIVHLRPSGNAPELRCYTESDSQQQAEELNIKAIDVLRNFSKLS